MHFFRSLAELIKPAPRLREVGFWAAMPNEPWEGVDSAVHPSRPHPSALIDRFWSSQERQRVIDYLRRGQEHETYFGYSVCRLCGLTDLGCKDLTDGVWIWPDGFVHYLEMHAVKPPQEFVDRALRRVR